MARIPSNYISVNIERVGRDFSHADNFFHIGKSELGRSVLRETLNKSMFG